MSIPIPIGKQITVQKDIYPNNYCMPSMEIADHYDINYIIKGDRKAITPLFSYSYHKGDITMGSPYTYHRTVSESDIPYERYLIKFTPDFIEPFIKYIGKDIFNNLFEQKLFHFSEKTQIKIKQIFSEMLEEYNKKNPYKEFILQGMLNRLLTVIWENKLTVEVKRRDSPLTNSILDAIYYIENNYAKDITLNKAAKESHFSPSHFSRLFKVQLGVSFTEYVGNVRIEHVKKMLIQTNKSIMEIALETGYCNGDYLSSKFKSKVGMTPSEFRRSLK